MRRFFEIAVKIIIAFVFSAWVISALTVMVGADNEDADGVDIAEVRRVIRDGFYSFKESIDISSYGILPEELGGLFSSLIKDDPYLFFVDGQMSYSYKPGGFVVSLKPKYEMKGQEVFEAWDECRAYIRQVAGEAMAFDGEMERALFLHDYICQSFEYDTELKSDNIYTMIKSGRATCEGYTDMYMAILRECGIESHFVASDTISHIWNYVKIDGEWYHVDLTWDDSDDGVRYRHFLLSDSAALERGHRDWYSVIDASCNSEVYLDAVTSAYHVGYFCGDADHDGRVGLGDIIALKMNFEFCDTCADINGDLLVNELDVEALRHFILREK